MHIVFLVGFMYDGGGIATYMHSLVPRLIERGVHVHIICFDSDSTFHPHCQLTRLRPKPTLLPGFWRFETLIRKLNVARAMARIPLQASSVAICSEEMLAAPFVRRYPQCPLIYLPHSYVAPVELATYGFQGIQKRLAVHVYSKLQQRCLELADVTIRFTSKACNDLSTYYGTPDTRFQIIPLAVDIPDDAPPVLASRELVRLLFVGRLVRSKNVDLVLRTLARVRRPTWKLDVVGDGPERENLDSLAHTLGINERVRFCGYQENCGTFYASADLIVFPSRLENCPTVVLEAMAHSRGVVAVRSNGTTYRNPGDQLIEASGGGFLADTEEQFESTLRQAMESRATLRTAGSRGREYVRANHTWERHVDELLKTARELSTTTLAPTGQ